MNNHKTPGGGGGYDTSGVGTPTNHTHTTIPHVFFFHGFTKKIIVYISEISSNCFENAS